MAFRSSPPTAAWPDLERELALVGAAAGQAGGAAASCELDRLRDLPPGSEAIGEPGGEAVARPVGVADRPGQRGGPPAPPLAAVGLPFAPGGAERTHHHPRLGIEVAGAVELTGIAPARDERVELDVGVGERVEA